MVNLVLLVLLVVAFMHATTARNMPSDSKNKKGEQVVVVHASAPNAEAPSTRGGVGLKDKKNFIYGGVGAFGGVGGYAGVVGGFPVLGGVGGIGKYGGIGGVGGLGGGVGGLGGGAGGLGGGAGGLGGLGGGAGGLGGGGICP